ncbi:MULTISPECIES: hypothetical protein [Haloprofundus]|uniref:hypothetical protein n=1 Tax=Haloprofundus TaxID=1911573 RepID=UPI000E44F42E|nr:MULTISPECIES: hypothetical protein [Haloprofundus]QCJ47169.1 hypothetical protein FCF25_08595 [Haloprofundus sp. MHR1]
MGPLEANGYRLGIVVIAFGLSRQLLDLGAYRGELTVILGATIAVLAVLVDTATTLRSRGDDREASRTP